MYHCWKGYTAKVQLNLAFSLLMGCLGRNNCTFAFEEAQTLGLWENNCTFAVSTLNILMREAALVLLLGISVSIKPGMVVRDLLSYRGKRLGRLGNYLL
jgi:hypothetical protein